MEMKKNKQNKQHDVCRRLISWGDKLEKIEVASHVFAYSGSIPCTGTLKCIYCGKYKEDSK